MICSGTDRLCLILRLDLVSFWDWIFTRAAVSISAHIRHWACPSRWSWSHLWSSGLSSGSILDLAWSSPSSGPCTILLAPPRIVGCERIYTISVLRFWQGCGPKTPLPFPAAGHHVIRTSLSRKVHAFWARIHQQLGRDDGETVKLHIERLWPKWRLLQILSITITAAAARWVQCHVKAGRTTDSCPRAGYNNNPIGSQTERIT